MVTSTKKSTRLSDSRNPILSCKTKWPLWCSECSSGGYEFTSVNFYFLPPSGNFNPLVGKASNSVTSKNLKNNDLEKLPHTLSLTHWHTYHFALFYGCIYAHDNKRYHLWSVFSCFFSHYHSSWLLLLQWWWVQLLCVPLRMVNFELWPGETWTVKGETLSSHVISVIQLGWQLWSLDSKNRQNKIIWDFVIYKTEGTHYKS